MKLQINKEKMLDALNDLLARNRDAYEGYKAAGVNSGEGELRIWLFDNAERRKKFIAQLQMIIQQNGGTTDTSNGFLSTLHGTWIDLKTQASNHTAEIVLEECKRGENEAIEDYKEILNKITFPNDIRSILVNQHNEIVKSLATVDTILPMYEEA